MIRDDIVRFVPLLLSAVELREVDDGFRTSDLGLTVACRGLNACAFSMLEVSCTIGRVDLKEVEPCLHSNWSLWMKR